MQTAYPTLVNLANIQCENCHGPGSQHAYGAWRHQSHHQDGQFRRLQPVPRQPDPMNTHGTQWYVSAPRHDDRPQQRQLLTLSLGQWLY